MVKPHLPCPLPCPLPVNGCPHPMSFTRYVTNHVLRILYVMLKLFLPSPFRTFRRIIVSGGTGTSPGTKPFRGASDRHRATWKGSPI